MGRHARTHDDPVAAARPAAPVSRRTVLAALAALPVVAAGAGAAVHASRPAAPAAGAAPLPAPTVRGTRYFVSPDGDDDAPGTDAGTAWRTVDGVNRHLADGTVTAGDAVLFRSGATFPGKLRPKGIDLDADAGARLLISAYAEDGSTARPVLSSYKLLDVPSAWQAAAPGEWVVDLSDEAYGNTHHGYSGAQGGADNIGFLRVDGVIHGRRCDTRAQLAQQWDFCCEGTQLRVRSAANPSTAAADLRAACGETCIELADGLEIRGLRLEGGGAHGVQGTARGVTVADNEICELGGSLLDAGTRYGNGVEIWIGSADVEVDHNVLHDIYDVALTMQGNRSDRGDGWSGISFTENLVYRCNQSLEFWSDGPAAGARGFSRCTASRNVCLFAGQGWSGPVRPDQDRKVHLLTYGWSLPADVRVVTNVFHDAASGYRWSAGDTPGLVPTGNIVRLRPGTRLTNRGPETVEDGAATEQGTSFVVLGADVTSDVGATLREIRDAPGLDDRARALLDSYGSRYS